MPVKLQCPHCRKALAVPSKYLGSTANCPQCGGVFQAPESVPEESRFESSTSFAGLSVAQNAAGAAAAPKGFAPAPAANNSEGKVARFITPEKAQSRLTLESGGRLPDLSLVDAPGRRRQETSEEGSNPALLTIVLGASFLVSALLLLVDFDGAPSDPETRRNARLRIEREFFSEGAGPFPEFEIYLRRAQQAHSRGALEEERQWYRRVLQLLHAEGKNRYVGVTGSPSRDALLKELVSDVLQ